MRESPFPIERLLSKIPFRFLVPFFYLLFASSILLYVLFSPFVYLYGLLRCSEVWIEWSKHGKNVVVVSLDSEHSQEWMSRLLPLLSGRAVFLNWSTRKDWDRASLAVQLFEIFGPHGIPEQFTGNSLPAVIVLRTFHRPKVFTFGERSESKTEKLEQLQSVLRLC